MATDDRMNSMESQIARLTAAVFVAVFMSLASASVAVFTAIGSRSPHEVKVPAEIRAGKFVVIDGEGRVRGGLMADGPNGASLGLIDSDGKLRAVLSAEQKALTVFDANGRRRALLHVMDDSSTFKLIDLNEQARIALGYIDGTGPNIVVANGNGDPVWQAP